MNVIVVVRRDGVHMIKILPLTWNSDISEFTTTTKKFVHYIG